MSSPPPVSGTSGHVTPPMSDVRLGQMLGQGGLTIAYVREQISLGYPVAAKIDSRSLHDKRNRRRFMRETAAASRISGHPNAVPLIDSGMLPDGRPYLVTECCDGDSLAQALQHGELNAAQAVSTVMAVCSALGAVHDTGVLRRDVKLRNIFIDAYRSLHLSDFGLAVVQYEGIDPLVTLETMTSDFASPEAFILAAPSPRGDMRSMGAVPSAFLIGRDPQRAANDAPQSLLEIANYLSAPTDTPDVRIPEALRLLFDWAPYPNPAQRYRDSSGLTEILIRAGGLSYGAFSTPHSALRDSHPLPAMISIPTVGSRYSNRALMLLALGVTTGAVISVAMLGTVGSIDPVPLVDRAVQGASASSVLYAGARVGQGADSRPSTTVRAIVLGSRKASSSSTAAPTPVQISTRGISYSDDMPWLLGTCLSRTTLVVGGTSVSQVDYSQVDQIVSVSGTFGPATTVPGTAETMTYDPQVETACISDYAQRYGLDLSTSYTTNTLGPNDEEWVAGGRGFTRVLGRSQNH